ncbi:ANTH domain-containing protein [Lipomyces tetrasporus]|uniref:ANTH domain-containing protein n=1 Tax=Lipomyces tetrasporus TaxID=54092 RepID=A0AAD7QWK0_9ASCO|nr:ANTH domain-containing protein [Lipomyces tetrasporus]KAJ8102852.1 ANTH domain-containing protein [Lipomyces tetrasporus]
MSLAHSGRGYDLTRADADLAVSIKKATSMEETAPKRKHVRSCIVYTWDHRSSAAFWASLKIQPVLADEVQTFKALIMVHRVLQEGHPSVLREAQAQISWIETCARSTHGEGSKGYGPLIREYVDFLLSKLRFHKTHPEFNGTFEYEEYVSLKTIDDPNEGYETISDLMNLQDQINSFQRLIFSHFRHGSSNECRISSLVALVHESYGIYKFVTSMLRAMHATTNSDDALEPLRIRYEAQHHRLVKFYDECANLRYLTSLISIPKLPLDPPDLFKDDDDDAAPSLPRRPNLDMMDESSLASPGPELAESASASSTDLYAQQLAAQQKQYEEEQRRLAAQREAEMYHQQQLALQQQRDFEEHQRLAAEQQRLAQEQLMRDQLQRQAQGRVAELERDILALRGQYDQDQLMLERYDGRVKALESEIQQLTSTTSQQLASKDDQIKSLQEQLAAWKSKYDALAKLYSQLRSEHIDLMAKYKAVQAKAASAQEAIDKKEKLEKELKAKNLDLADLIRERDRAKLELDRVRGGQNDEVGKLRRELDDAQQRLDTSAREKGAELSTILARHNREIGELEQQLHAKQRALDDLSDRVKGFDGEAERLLREREEELEVYKTGLDEALLRLNDMSLNQKDADSAIDGQIDGILIGHVGKLKSIIDAVLQSSAQRVADAVYELDSPMQAGNQNSSPNYLLSMVEKGSATATDFATAFNNFIADGPNGDHAEIIKTSAIFSGAMADILINAKGLTRLASDEKRGDMITNVARESALSAEKFFTSLFSEKLEPLSTDQRTDRVISNNLDVQRQLQRLSKLAETFAPPKRGLASSGLFANGGDIGEIVDREMNNAADAIAKAAARLNQLMQKPKNPGLSSFDLKIHDAILASAIAVTNAVAALIKAATESQQEIVAQGRGSSTRTAFYKKHNRWTEGLISAAKAVATSTNVLIETADGVISGNNSLEQLIVASNDVAASTAQLVAASRVKASFMSKTQDRLEGASKAVNSACRSLVSQVQAILQQRGLGDEFGEPVDYSKLSAHEFKRREMEQQVEILKLENELAGARKTLGEIRKVSYRQDIE